MIISTSNDLENLDNDQFRKRIVENLIIDGNSLNDMNGDLILSGLDNLEKIIVKENSLQNLNSLKICNNEELSNIEIENGVFSNVNNVIIESKFRNLMIWYLYLPKLQSFETGNQSFFNTTSLSLSSRIYLYQ